MATQVEVAAMADVLQGKIVAITGAAGGFGQAMVRQFMRAGSQVVLADVREDALRTATAHVLKEAGLEAQAGQILGYVGSDLSTQAGCDAAYAQMAALAPQIDILVNNAGIGMSGLFSETPRDRWEALMQINLLAPMRLVACALPAMLARRSGHIVNVASVAGIIGTAQLVAYSTAKFGVRGFSEALANEVQPYGIAVTALFPFFSRTPILQSPHYGSQPQQALPDSMITDPDDVIAALLRGIRRKQREVYPDRTARVLHFLKRYAPGIIPRLNRQLRPNQ
jgi:short-subunit dehydrogenase